MNLRLKENIFYEHHLKSVRNKPENKSVQKKSASMTTSGFFNGKNTTKENINFTGNPAKAISSSNAYKTAAKGMKKFGDKILGNPLFLNFTKTSMSQAMLEAGAALVLSGVLRPLTILATNKKDDKDAQYASVHSVTSAAIGYGFSCAIVKPIKKGIERFFKDPNLKKPDYLLKKVAKGLTSNKDNFTAFAEYAPQVLLITLKAVLTIKFIPPIMNLLFPNHKKDKKDDSKSPQKIEIKGQDQMIKKGQLNRTKSSHMENTFKSFVKEQPNNAN